MQCLDRVRSHFYFMAVPAILLVGVMTMLASAPADKSGRC